MQVLTDTEGVVIRLMGGALFDSGKADVNAEYEKVLRRVVGALRTENAVLALEVTGHTDQVPMSKDNRRFASNLELSQARAESVRDLLVDYMQDPALRIFAKGVGATEPLAGYGPKASQQRRVEIRLLLK